MKFLLAGVVESIANFIGDSISNFTIGLDTIFYIGIGFQTLMVIFYLIKSHYAYEGRLERSLDKLSRWLYYHKTIDSSNLIEFNNRIKKSPKLLRYHWQQYMLYRENPPSHYMSAYNCIEKPLHTSSYAANLKNLSNINITAIFISFVLSFAVISGGLDSGTILKSTIVPMIICILNTLFLMLLRSMQNFNLSSLYQNFHLFQRYIDKAAVTLPEYVDFEVLFTRKEIRKGIPVLNEYLEKRARQEQEELEKARLNAVEHEKYDFSQSGIDGALVLDRAIKETEVYLNIRQRLLYEIQQLESEIESLKRNYENTSKEYQRKMQASKENVERLRKQQEETTNRIESNYIKKQQSDEIKKQEQLEKDQDDATLRFNQQITSLQSEIDKRRVDLEERKGYVQTAMLAEYQTFSNKLYNKISDQVQERFDAEKTELSTQKDEFADELNEKNAIIESKNHEIAQLKEVIERAGVDAGAHGLYYSEELQKEADKVRRGKHNEEKKPEEVAAEEPVVEFEEPANEEVVVNQPLEETLEPEQLQETEQTQTDEYEGYYDENGYYWYPNGTYYDNLGNYHDELGGVYDPEGNYTPAATVEETETEQEQPVKEPVETMVEDVAPETEQQPKEQEEQEQPVQEIMEDVEKLEVEPEVELQSVEVEQPEEIATQQPAEIEGQEIIEEVKELPQEEVKQEPETVEEKPKGKRGRPKKVVGEKPQVEEKPKGKRGRPKKETSEETEEKPKTGKRGRPKKSETANAEEKPKTGKRGRPKKESSDEEAKPAGKRGRPKKAESEDQEVKSTGKRGRPKGSTKPTITLKKKSTGKRGRPKGSLKAAEELKIINEQILAEQKKLLQEQKELNETIKSIKADDNNEGDQ